MPLPPAPIRESMYARSDVNPVLRTPWVLWFQNIFVLLSNIVVTGTTMSFVNVPSYANNAAAIAGGLTAGMIYRNGDVLQIVH